MPYPTNHFRTRLANLTYESPADFIDSGFTAITLPSQQQAVYNLLFPTSISDPGNRAAILDYASAYTVLLDSFRLADVFSLYSPTITYQLTDLYDFENPVVNLVSAAELVVNSTAANNLVGDNLNLKYDKIYSLAIPNIQRLAGLVAGYSYRLG